MKVKVSVELDIPELYYRDDEDDKDIVDEKLLEDHHMCFVRDVVFSKFYNYAICRHLIDAGKWIGKSEAIANYHNRWADILQEGEHTLTIEKI